MGKGSDMMLEFCDASGEVAFRSSGAGSSDLAAFIKATRKRFSLGSELKVRGKTFQRDPSNTRWEESYKVDRIIPLDL